jgi:hypothetical protein
MENPLRRMSEWRPFRLSHLAYSVLRKVLLCSVRHRAPSTELARSRQKLE